MEAGVTLLILTLIASKFISNNPKFIISALSQYTQNDFINLIKKHNIKYHEKKLGQLFCDQSAQQIVDMLLLECQKSKCYYHE